MTIYVEEWPLLWPCIDLLAVLAVICLVVVAVSQVYKYLRLCLAEINCLCVRAAGLAARLQDSCTTSLHVLPPVTEAFGQNKCHVPSREGREGFEW